MYAAFGSVVCILLIAQKTYLGFNFLFKVLFLRWVLTVFDLIDCKDQLRSIYGFIFSFVTEENLVFSICLIFPYH